MTGTTFLTRTLILGLLVAALAAGDALARGGKGGGGSGGHSSGHSGGSFSSRSSGHSGGGSSSHSSGSFSSRSSGHSGSSFSGHSGSSRSSGSWSGGSGRSSHSQSFSRSGSSKSGTSQRSFSSGSRSSSGSSSSHQGSSFRNFSSSRLQQSARSGHGGSQALSQSLGKSAHSGSAGGGQPGTSFTRQRFDANSNSKGGHAAPGGVQQAGAWQSSNRGRGSGFAREGGWGHAASGDEVRSFLQLSADQHHGGGSGNHGSGNRSGGSHGSDSQQQTFGTRLGNGYQSNRSGDNHNGQSGHGGQTFSSHGNDNHNDRQHSGQGGQFNTSRNGGGDHGDHGRGGNWSGGHGGDVAHRGWSRKTNGADFQRMADSVRRQWHDRDYDHNHGHGRPFYGDWWKHYRHGPSYHGWFYWDRYVDRPYFWWSWSAAPRITAWFSFGWPRPYYWDYGPDAYIYSYNGVIYVNGQWYMPAREYYQRTYVLAQRVPEITPQEAQQIEWLPLGVFALTPEGTDQSNLLLQLAVTGEGVLGGTLFNQATGESFPVEGVVEKTTQRAVWSYVNAAGDRIVMETGIFNLSKPDCTMLVHFGPDDMQIWQMVHMEQPNDSAAAPPAAAGPEMPQPVLPAPK